MSILFENLIYTLNYWVRINGSISLSWWWASQQQQEKNEKNKVLWCKMSERYYWDITIFWQDRSAYHTIIHNFLLLIYLLTFSFQSSIFPHSLFLWSLFVDSDMLFGDDALTWDDIIWVQVMTYFLNLCLLKTNSSSKTGQYNDV